MGRLYFTSCCSIGSYVAEDIQIGILEGYWKIYMGKNNKHNEEMFSTMTSPSSNLQPQTSQDF